MNDLAFNRHSYAQGRGFDGAGRATVQHQYWYTGAHDYPWNKTHDYDDAGRLAGTTDWVGRRAYHRDAAGTLLSEIEPNGTVRFQASTLAPAGHELASVTVGGTAMIPIWDDVGRLTADGAGRSYTWDPFGALVRADVPGSWRYLYDAFGRRVEKAGPGGVVERSVYDGWHAIATYDGTGALTKRVVFGPLDDQPLSVMQDGDVFYPAGNTRGDIVTVFDDAAQLVEQPKYDDYGNMYLSGPSLSWHCEDTVAAPCQPVTGFGFNGQLRDEETGLYYYKNRYYSPTLRSFLSRDPLGFVDSTNPWLYVGGDPVNKTDPLGLDASGTAADATNEFADFLSHSTNGAEAMVMVVAAIEGGTPEAFAKVVQNASPALKALGYAGVGLTVLTLGIAIARGMGPRS